jgi:H2-forming N5,N10-methylenetetrahydromethanopterin dehydrogenase-like enzyme
VLRREFAALKPAHVPDAPTHASLVAAAGAKDATVYAAADDVTGQVRDEDPQEVQAR